MHGARLLYKAVLITSRSVLFSALLDWANSSHQDRSYNKAWPFFLFSLHSVGDPERGRRAAYSMPLGTNTVPGNLPHRRVSNKQKWPH